MSKATITSEAITDTVREIARQARVLRIPGTRLQVNARCLRISHKTSGGYVYNTDITLNGRDLYDVTVYQLDMRMRHPLPDTFGEVVYTAEFFDIYAESLPIVVGIAGVKLHKREGRS